MESTRRNVYGWGLKNMAKALSWLLRHGAIKEGIAMRDDGFCDLYAVLAHQSISKFNPTLADIKWLAQANGKMRLELIKEGRRRFIRAVQGHSIEKLQLGGLLTPVTGDVRQ